MVLSKKTEEIISKGASVKADNNDKGWSNFNLRIRNDLVAKIEEDLEENVGLTKTGWILQAIQEKIRKNNG